MSIQAVIADRLDSLDLGDSAASFADRLRTANAARLPALVAALGSTKLGSEPTILSLLLELGRSGLLAVSSEVSTSELAERLNELEAEQEGVGSDLWDVLGHEGVPVLAYHHDVLDTLVLCDDGTAVVTWNDQTRRWEVRLADMDDLGALRETARL